MPRKYKPFDVMKDTGARERLARGGYIEWGPVGPPPDCVREDDRVAWLDLTDAAAPGILEPIDKFHIELTASWLAKARRGELNKRWMKELRKCLRCMFLTPAVPTTPEQQHRAMLEKEKPRGPVN